MKRGAVFFSYLFFSLFVFVAVSLLVSKFSSTFSQLFSLLSQNGRIFSLVYCGLLFSGFLLSLYSLIIASWNHREDLRFKTLMIVFCLGFIVLFVFALLDSTKPIALLSLILDQKQTRGIADLLLKNWVDFLSFGLFYIAFVVLPLADRIFGFSLDTKHAFGLFLEKIKPSIDITIYTLFGSALQSYWHKGHLIFYLDLIALMVGFVLLGVVYVRNKKEFGFHQKCNLSFLCMGVIVFAMASDLITEDTFIVRYDFLLLAFLAWCAEWMLSFCFQEEENPPLA